MRASASAVLPCFAVAAVLTGCGTAVAGTSSIPSRTRSATIAYVVDGDTLRVDLDGQLTYVRLVGIDTPEEVRPGVPVECGARPAAVSLRHLAPEGATVRLVPDSVAASHDRYGRLLAHVLVADRQLEIVQLRRGWAEVYRYRGQRFDGFSRFDAAQARARAAARGVWGLCGGDFHRAG